MTENDMLYLVAWLGPDIPDRWKLDLDTLAHKGLVAKTTEGAVLTQEGRDKLSPLARRACRRPRNYKELSPRQQWDVDKSLGILDWDGT